jgi:hypothetical protein
MAWRRAVQRTDAAAALALAMTVSTTRWYASCGGSVEYSLPPSM